MSKFTHAVVAQYAIGAHAKGDVLSKHSSYELARAAAKRAGDHFTAVRPIKELAVDVSKAQNVKRI